ncbi:transposase [Streptomyces sp. NPDC005244]|uniref:transposase n=1 Tax=Streptomyces sp. NPDC005244 TaxID=3364708 RepID=UPI0036A57944
MPTAARAPCVGTAPTEAVPERRHVAADTLGLVLAVIVTAASVHNSTGGKRLLDVLATSHPSVTKVWADGGYQNSVFQQGQPEASTSRS